MSFRRSTEVCGRALSTSSSRASRPSAATRRCGATSWREPAPRSRGPLRLLVGHGAPARRRAARRADRVLPLLQARPQRTPQGRQRPRPGARPARPGPLGDRDRRSGSPPGHPGVAADGVGHPQRRGHRTPGAADRAGPAPRLEPVRAKALSNSGRPEPVTTATTPGCTCSCPPSSSSAWTSLVGAARYPATKVLSSFHSLGSLLMLKASRRGRAANAFPLGG